MVSDGADVIIALKFSGFYVFTGNGNTAVDGLATASCPATCEDAARRAKAQACQSGNGPVHRSFSEGGSSTERLSSEALRCEGWKVGAFSAMRWQR